MESSALRNIERRTIKVETEILRLKSRLAAVLSGDQISVSVVSAHGFLSTSHIDTTAAGPTRGAIITAQGASPAWVKLLLTVPAANVRNVFGVDNGEVEPSWKTALDATAPVTQAAGDAAAAGTSLIFSHRDHKHGMPASFPATAHNLLSATHGDSAVSAAVRGSIIVGNSTPAWARVGVGLAGSVVFSDGTDTTFTINPTIAGYVRVGSSSAPSNVTAGDLTAIRVVFGTDAVMPASTSIYLNAAVKVNGNIGFFNTTPTTQQTSGANVTNNVTAGGSSDVIADFSDLVIYANDASSIRDDIYQLARKIKQVNDGLRALGLLT